MLNPIDRIANMGAIDIDLQIKHHFSTGVYARQMMFPAGNIIMTHSHNYDHMSILASGEVAVETDGVIVIYRAPAVITILAGQNHRIEARKDAVWFCIHATDEKDPAHLDDVLIRR